MKTKDLVSLFDEFLAQRKNHHAQKLIPKLLRQCKKEGTYVETADVLFRILDFVKAFRFLSDVPNHTYETKLLLANAANFLGASCYALRIFEDIPESVRIKRPVETGQILSTNHQDLDALNYFANIGTKNHPKPREGIQGLRALLLRCYCLIELERYDEIHSISEYFLKSTSPGRAAFAHVFQAWAFVGQGKYQNAKRSFKNFDHLPGTAEQTWPLALYCQVKGIYFAKNKKYSEALRYLKRAWNLSFHPGWQPEAAWLNILFWQGYARYKKSKSLPMEWARLYFYPGVLANYQQKVSQQCEIPDKIILAPNKISKSPLKQHLLWSNRMWFLNGRLCHKFDKTVELAGLLVIAGPLGIPMFRIFDRLWPDQPLSIKSHLKRLEQLVNRLKKQNIFVIWKDNHLWIDPKAQVSVLLTPCEKSPIFPFLNSNKKFTRKDVEIYFKVSPSTAKRLCKKWINSQTIQKSKQGFYVCT